MVRVLGQEVEEAAQAVGNRVEPGDDEEVTDVDDLLAGEPLTIDLGLEQIEQQPFGALVQDAVEGRLEVLVAELAGILAGLELGLEGGFAVAADDPLLDLQEQVEILERQTEQAEEHRAGKRHG